MEVFQSSSELRLLRVNLSSGEEFSVSLRRPAATYEAVLFPFGVFAALYECLLDLCVVEVGVVILQRLVKLLQEGDAH